MSAKKKVRERTVRTCGESWEYVAGDTFIAVRMSPKSPRFSPTYSFVMEKRSEDVRSNVIVEVERRYGQAIINA